MTEAEGDALLKKGDKKCLPSLMSMRLRPDWEAAAPLYERAAAAYKAAGCGSKAKVAYEKAAHANDRLDSPWHAGKFIEKAAQLASEPKDAHSLARQASDYYIKAGKIREAADALGRGAKLLEETAPEIAGSLYKEAIGIHRNEQRAAQASDLVSQAVALQVEQQQHRQAAELLSQFAQDCLEANAVNSAHKAYLGAVVVQVYAGDMEAAWASYQDALEVHSFATSDEAHAGEALFAAYSSGDEAAVRQLPKGQAALRFLDASVARLARQLPQGDFAVQAQTAGQLLKMGTVHTLGAEAGEEEEEEEDLR